MFSWYPQYEALFAQTQLVLLMLGMGAKLSVTDFLQVLRAPRSFLIAAAAQLFVLPLFAVGINQAFGLTGGVAVGLILVACMPGGALSKLFTYLARGNVPLSITLSAFTTLSTVIFVPLWLNLLAADYVPQGFSVPADRVVIDVCLFLLLPLVVGMVIGRAFAQRRDLVAKVCVRLGLVVVVAMVTGALGSGRIDPGAHGLTLPLAIILFCVGSMLLVQVPFVLLGLARADRAAAAVEATLRNMNLALLLYAEFFHDSELGKGVLFVILFYAATAMVAGVPLILSHRLRSRHEQAVGESGN